MTDAYPLQFPPGWPRTAREKRERARFQGTFGRIRDDLINEVRRLGGKNIVLSTNIRLTREGIPYSKEREPDDSGVAVYFELYGDQQCIPCDKWNHVIDNMRAIHLTIEALRGIERWGSKHMVKASFQGFKALPAPEGYIPSEDYFAGLTNSEDLRARYRTLCLELHPDKGGDAAKFTDMVRQYKAKGMEG